MELFGKRVLVTGASRGIGEALAEAFAGAGAHVVLVARSEAPIQELAQRLGGNAYAGFEEAGDFATQSAEAIDAMIGVNLTAAVHRTRQVVPGMLERGSGHIVNISSMGSASVFPGLAVYSATKAALSHFTAGLRADFRARPIGTTLVELGATTTDMLVGVKSYGPTRAAFDRSYGLRVFVDTPPERVAEAVIAAVQKNRRYVRLPTRAALFPMLAELPRRLTELLRTGAGTEIR